MSVRNAFLKYALQVKRQLGYVSLAQLGSVGVNWGQEGPKGVNQGQVGLRGTKNGLSPDRLEVKWVLVGNVDWLGE